LQLVPVSRPADAVLGQRRLRVRRLSAVEPVRPLARVGGAAAIWLAVFFLYAAGRPVGIEEVVATTIATAIWLVTLGHAFSAVPATLGLALPAAMGSGTGLVAVAALNPQLPGQGLDTELLLALGVGVFVSAVIWEWFVRKTSAGRRRVLVIGRGPLIKSVAKELERPCGKGFLLVGSIELEGPEPSERESANCLSTLEALGELIALHRPDLVVLADEQACTAAIDRLLDAAGTQCRVVDTAGFFEHVFGRVPLEHVSPAWFMGLVQLRLPVYARWWKRTFDLVVAAILLVLMLPLVSVIALLVRASGPVIYRQTRLGEHGRPFTIFKFRTMALDAEVSGRPQWASSVDSRATSVGRVLRQLHLDELPQLWNVLKGEMSIVGPRPERPEFVTQLEHQVPYWSRRLLVQPGITGWAQVRSGYADDYAKTAEKLSYDLWYLRHRNLAVDVAICVRTASLVVRSALAGPTCEAQEARR
jgi:exopolysaccharide biosynthesis polyprenyl glycosylphosphotransferase